MEGLVGIGKKFDKEFAVIERVGFFPSGSAPVCGASVVFVCYDGELVRAPLKLIGGLIFEAVGLVENFLQVARAIKDLD